MIEYTGTVRHGKGMGSRIGYPTANLAIGHAPDVRYGVYAAVVYFEQQPYPAIVNIGKHPTLPDGPPTIEIHLLDVTLDLYGRTLTVRLVEYIRPEQAFPSLDALRDQIARDIRSARQTLGGTA